MVENQGDTEVPYSIDIALTVQDPLATCSN